MTLTTLCDQTFAMRGRVGTREPFSLDRRLGKMGISKKKNTRAFYRIAKNDHSKHARNWERIDHVNPYKSYF